MSRYPAMSQAPLPYDRSLLAGAPSLTRQDRQAGYDVNALEQGTYPQPVPTRTMGQEPAPPAASDPFGDQYADNRAYSPTSTTTTDQRPWWKRKRWAALALIIFIGIICGIVAGVVTARNSRNTTNLITSPEGQNQDGNNASVASSPSTPPAVGATPTRTTATPALTSDPRGGNVGNSNGNGNGNPGVTVVIGRPTSTQPPAGVILPTATGRPASPDDGFDDPELSDDGIPLICYFTPTSRQCAHYFESDPPRLF